MKIDGSDWILKAYEKGRELNAKNIKRVEMEQQVNQAINEISTLMFNRPVSWLDSTETKELKDFFDLCVKYLEKNV